MSAEDEHTDGIFDEDPDSWQSFEQMMEVGKKKKLHTFYKTHDIVRNIEAGYIEHHLEDPRKEKIHFRRAKLYGRGLNGIKTIKTKIAKDNLPSEVVIHQTNLHSRAAAFVVEPFRNVRSNSFLIRIFISMI